MQKPAYAFIVGAAALAALFAAVTCAADEPPSAPSESNLSQSIKATGAEAARQSKAVAGAIKENAGKVGAAAKEVAHQVAVASVKGAHQVKAAAKDVASKTKSAVKSDSPGRDKKAPQ
jgi:hypothetical protein